MNSLLIEKIYPLTIGIIGGIAAYFFLTPIVESTKEEIQLAIYISTTSILTLIIISILEVLLNNSKSKILEDLKRLGRKKSLDIYFIEANFVWGLLPLITVILLLISDEYKRLTTALIDGILLWAILALYRITKLTIKILKIEIRKQNDIAQRRFMSDQ